MRGRGAARTALQLAGFVVGLALIAYCIYVALRGDGAAKLKDHLAHASPWVVAGLLGTSLVSLLANGLLFWQTLRPVHRLRLRDVQFVNAMASVLNYAPLPMRLGLVARVAYHWRVDKMSIALIGAWLAAVLLNVAVIAGPATAAMPLVPLAGVPVAIVAALLLVAVALASSRWLAARPFLARKLHGAERMVTDTRSFAIAGSYRLVDMAMWALRMPLAAMVVDAPLTFAQSATLGICAFLLSMNPLGRFGFREAAVAWIASSLFAGSMSASEVTTVFAQLAIVESAAEGVIAIGFGGPSALWCWRRAVAARGQAADRP